MRSALERWLLERWYGRRQPPVVLRALSWLYRKSLAARDWWWRTGGRRAEAQAVPVLVVGNFTAGGAGKTPLVIALARHLSRLGRRPGVATRGHGRRRRAPIRVTTGTAAEDCGDEPLLIHLETGVPVQVDRNRARAARVLAEAGCDIVLADDGLQHRALARDIEIEVRDAARGLGNGRLLPAGPLREWPRPVDFLVVNGGEASSQGWAMRLALAEVLALDGSVSQPLSAFAGRRVHAVAGIGHPERFFAALRAAGLDVAAHAFRDHHAFVPGDFRGMEGPILMTSKDAVKCRGLRLADAWEVPVRAVLPPGFWAALDARLAALAHSPAP